MSSVSSWLGSRLRNLLPHVLWLTIISLLYWAVFLLPLPTQFKKRGVLLTDEFLLLFLLVLVFITYRQQGWGAKYLRLGLTLIVFTLPLLRTWETGESTWNIVLGLLPWMDARGYYADSNRLIEGGLYSSFSGRRPLFASFLAVILKLGGQNLQLVLILFTVITAVVVFLLADEIRDELGSVSALIALYLCQLFYRPLVGTTLSEQLGYPMGLLALIVLIRSVKAPSLWLYLLGMALLTYALLIRAGTFFALPVLILFAMFHFTAKRQQYPGILVLTVISILLPVLSNIWLGRVVASPNAVQFANFADTLYGQARGGVRWTQAVIDHPELNSMVEPERSRLLYSLAFEEIRKNPLGLVRGSLKALADFIRPGMFSAFGFVTFGNKAVDFIVQLLVALVFLFGLWKMWGTRSNPLSRFALVYWIGTLLSIPFLPPIDAGIRPYAATIASIFWPVCFVFSEGSFKQVESPPNNKFKIPVGVSYTLAVGLIVISLVGVLLIKTTAGPMALRSLDCAPDLIPIHFKLPHGSYILLSSQADGHKTKVPVVEFSDVRASMDDFPYGDFAGIVRKLKQPVLIAAVNNLSDAGEIWVLAPPAITAFEGQMISACAKMVSPNYVVLSIEEYSNP